MSIRYDSNQYRNLLQEGALVYKPTKQQRDSFRRLREQFGKGSVRFELERRSTLDGDEYQPIIIIGDKGGNI